jgi:hypothetical protein
MGMLLRRGTTIMAGWMRMNRVMAMVMDMGTMVGMVMGRA